VANYKGLGAIHKRRPQRGGEGYSKSGQNVDMGGYLSSSGRPQT